MTAARVSRAPARGTVFRLYPLASPSGPLYIERVFLLLSCINQLIHHLHLYRSLYSNRFLSSPPKVLPSYSRMSLQNVLFVCTTCFEASVLCSRMVILPVLLIRSDVLKVHLSVQILVWFLLAILVACMGFVDLSRQ